jgi:hypothetical protein
MRPGGSNATSTALPQPSAHVSMRFTDLSIRQHTSAYVSIRQHSFSMRPGGSNATSTALPQPLAYVSIRLHSIRQHTAAYVSIRHFHRPPGGRAANRCLHYRHNGSIRQHTSAYVSIRQHTSAYVSIRQHTSTSWRPCCRPLSALSPQQWWSFQPTPAV